MSRRTTLLAVSVLLLSAASVSGSVSFTDAQATAGQALYEEHCSSCHANSLEGTHLAPSLVETRFDSSWRGKTADVLSFHIRRMPPESDAPEQPITEEEFTHILAYVLATNGFEAGEAALPTAMADLESVSIPLLPGQKVDVDKPVELSRRQQLRLERLPAVTAEMLADPPPGEWLYWSRKADGHSYSPLDAINKETVKNLAPAWRAPLRAGASMAVPLVVGGVMFVQSFPDTVLALDATNGEVLWRFQYEGVANSTMKSGLGISGHKIIVPTTDLHVVALDSRTGEKLWDHDIDTPHSGQAIGGYQLRSAPLVVGDKVLQGVTSSFIPQGGFILALDIETGEEAWRFNTIARPDEPGGNTWNGLPLDKRSGGSVWHQGTYDPELNLVYYGIAPTYDTGPLLKPSEVEGHTNDALYTNCTVALNADTGELVWYYQHMPNDQWDLDWVFERQIATVLHKGEERKVVMNSGKMAILEALDAETGEYLFSVDPGVQNVISAIDPETGAKTFDMERMPNPNREIVVCPSASGARSWPPTSYSPDTNIVYMPIIESCMGMGKQGFRLLTSGVGITNADHPDAADGMLGRIYAIDASLQEIAWTHDSVAPVSTGMLATGGGLVFAADVEPALKAFDERTGEVLWQTSLDDIPSSSMISYSVGEKQYLAVLVGISNLHIGTLLRSYAELLAKEGIEGSDRPKGGPAIWVFSL